MLLLEVNHIHYVKTHQRVLKTMIIFKNCSGFIINHLDSSRSEVS